MAKVQKTYTREFKEEAVRLAQTSGKPITQVARELGISDTSIHQWRRELTEHGKEAFPGSGLCWLLGTSVLKKREENDINFFHCLQTREGKGTIRKRQAIFIVKQGQSKFFKGEAVSVGRVLPHLQQLGRYCLGILHSRFHRWTKPLSTSLPLATLTDLSRSKPELIAENALLRQQLIILRRQVKGTACHKADRMLLILLARLVRNWKQALLIVQPDTLLRWHRELFRLIWTRRSKAVCHTPKVASETVALIREMATKNRLWGLSESGVNY